MVVAAVVAARCFLPVRASSMGNLLRLEYLPSGGQPYTKSGRQVANHELEFQKSVEKGAETYIGCSFVPCS